MRVRPPLRMASISAVQSFESEVSTEAPSLRATSTSPSLPYVMAAMSRELGSNELEPEPELELVELELELRCRFDSFISASALRFRPCISP